MLGDQTLEQVKRDAYNRQISWVWFNILPDTLRVISQMIFPVSILTGGWTQTYSQTKPLKQKPGFGVF